jgi:FkbM family methyltransferase
VGNLAKKMQGYRPGWDWEGMLGGRVCLKWNLQDLASLEQAITATKGRAVAVQAGGNLGIFPKRLAESFEAVYTFEPDTELFACLEHNAPEDNIVPVCAALGNSTDPVSLACHRRDNSGRDVHEGLTHVAGPGTIPQLRIDQLGLVACNLIYLDIEGYEFNALLGASETIERFHPTIALEVNGNIAHYGSTKQELREWMKSQGYRRHVRLHGDDIYVYVGGAR